MNNKLSISSSRLPYRSSMSFAEGPPSKPVNLLKQAEKETFELACLAMNYLLLSRSDVLLQKLDSELSGLKKDIRAASKKFQNLSNFERREEGYCLAWKICKVRTLIQERLRSVLDDRERLNLEDFSLRLSKIEIGCITPIITSATYP